MRGPDVMLAAVAVLVLGGLFWWMRPPSAPPVGRHAAASPRAGHPVSPPVATRSAGRALEVRSATPAPATASFELVVRGLGLVSGPTVLSVREGDPVAIHITSDRAEELHLHGYDLAVQLRPNERAALLFTASRSGRFEYELERSRTALGALEVQPR